MLLMASLSISLTASQDSQTVCCMLLLFSFLVALLCLHCTLNNNPSQITSFDCIHSSPVSSLRSKFKKLMLLWSKSHQLLLYLPTTFFSFSDQHHTTGISEPTTYMAHQEEGWPLGLQPLNFRIGLAGTTADYFGSISFNTLLTNSSTSSINFSTELDSESTGSYFSERSMTLGSLIGVSNILELSRRSMRRGRRAEPLKSKKPYKSGTWLFSLCSRHCTDVIRNRKSPPSLGHFLDVERRAAAAKQPENIDALRSTG